jgi:hypothetical protein
MVSGSTVNVAAGTYAENIVIDKPLTLNGEDQAGVVIHPSFSGPTCTSGSGSICPGGSNVILVKANNVTIQNLTVDGDNPLLTSGVESNGADIDARLGIIDDFPSGTYNGFNVNHVTVKNIYLRGIYAASGGTFDFSYNTVENVMNSAAMMNFGGTGVFAYNTIKNSYDGINSNWSQGTTYSYNVVTGTGTGIHTDNAEGSELIQYNTIDCTGVPGGYGIFTFVPYVAPTVDNNTITNCAVGLSAWGEGAAVTHSFTDNTVTGDLSTDSVGVYITTDIISWGYRDVSVEFTGNEISGFETGLYFTADEQSWNPKPYESKTINATFEDNKIVNNTTDAEAGTSGTLNIDASPNWWGSPCGPSVVIGDIDYSPWYVDEAMIITTDVEPVSGAFTFPLTMGTTEKNAIIACAAPGST